MRGIINAIYLPFIYSQLYSAIKYQRKFLIPYLSNDIEKFRLENDRSLDEQDFLKITNYYGLGVPAILGEAFCLLRGTKMTLKERLASTYQGAMTGLFDDFFDRKGIQLTEIIEIIENPYGYKGANSNERLFLHFYRKMLENVDSQDYVKKSLFDVYEAQVLSKKQTAPLLSREEIQEITFQKGGLSLLFYRSAFSHPIDKREWDMLYLIGGIMQLGNDIFDVYKDTQAEIETLVTTTKNINNVRLLLKDKMGLWVSLTNQLNYPQHNREAFSRFISFGMSRCFVCLDQLEMLEKRTNSVFSSSIYSRKELICDMEKVGNVAKSIKYYLIY